METFHLKLKQIKNKEQDPRVIPKKQDFRVKKGPSGHNQRTGPLGQKKGPSDRTFGFELAVREIEKYIAYPRN